MFIEVYEENDKLFKYISNINSDYIRRFFTTPDTDMLLFKLKVEMDNGDIYLVEEGLCRKEANYIADTIIKQIKNPENIENKVIPFDLKNYYESNSLTTYYDSGLIDNNEQLDAIVEKVLAVVPEGLEYDTYKLFLEAHKVLTPEEQNLFNNLINEYKYKIEVEIPTLRDYIY